MKIVIKTDELINKLENGLIDSLLAEKGIYLPKSCIEGITVDSNLTIVNLKNYTPPESTSSIEDQN